MKTDSDAACCQANEADPFSAAQREATFVTAEPGSSKGRQRVSEQKPAIGRQQRPPVQRRFDPRSRHTRRATGCRNRILDQSENRDVHRSGRFHRSAKTRRQSSRTEAIVTRLRIFGSRRNFRMLSMAATVIFTNRSTPSTRVSRFSRRCAARPTRRRTNQHGQADQQLEQAGKHRERQRTEKDGEGRDRKKVSGESRPESMSRAEGDTIGPQSCRVNLAIC